MDSNNNPTSNTNKTSKKHKPKFKKYIFSREKELQSLLAQSALDRLQKKVSGAQCLSVSSQLSSSFTLGRYLESSMASVNNNSHFDREFIIANIHTNHSLPLNYPPIKPNFDGSIKNKQIEEAKKALSRKSHDKKYNPSFDGSFKNKKVLEANKALSLKENDGKNSRPEWNQTTNITYSHRPTDSISSVVSNNRSTRGVSSIVSFASSQSSRRSTGISSIASSRQSSVSSRSSRTTMSTLPSLGSSRLGGSADSIENADSDGSAESGKSVSPPPKASNRLSVNRNTFLYPNKRSIEMDQLNLPDSVGKGGCRTRGYMVRPPGAYMLTRNASEIKLKHIKRLQTVDNRKLDRIVSVLQALAILMGISGILLCLFLMLMAINWSAMAYLKDYFNHYTFTFVFALGGIFQPLVVGIYCIFTVHHLNHIRPYFLRIPFTLIIPLGFFICGVKYINALNSHVESFLAREIKAYVEHVQVRYVLDGLQSSMSCCGIKSPADWKSKLNITGHASYPKSCCKNQEEKGCPDFALISSFHNVGCESKLENFHLGIGIFFCVLATLQFVFEVVSIYWMTQLFLLIKDEIDDPRSVCKILMGRCYSICDSLEYEKREEMAELGMLKFENLVRPVPASALVGEAAPKVAKHSALANALFSKV